MKKVVVTGGSGMLGLHLLPKLEAAGCEFIAIDRQHLNLEMVYEIKTRLAEICPAAIIHLAAETDVDLCEREPERAATKNFLATREIARFAGQNDCWLLYLSTSNVFGIEGRPIYNELDTPGPLNYYGKSKLAAEKSIIELCPNHLIIRAGWMIGGGPLRDHKFVGKLIGQIKAGAERLLSVNDKLGTITPAEKLADFILWAIRNRPDGLVHLACEGVVTRLDIVRMIAGHFGFKGNVIGVSSAMFPLSAPRPQSEAINSVVVRSYIGAPELGEWRQELAAYLKTF